VDIIESYVALKRAGSNYTARCPFHSEKTPSFTVSPSKQFYHCFGCGAHGTAISFLMEFHGMGFVEAVKNLASRVGMSVPETASSSHEAATQTPRDLTETLARAAQFYKSRLKQSERAIGYLKNRGLTGEIAARYGLGFAPDGWQSLEAEFPDYKSNKLLLDAGLVIDSAEGRRYDRFRDRIMFPIHNSRGAIIGFGGRIIDAGEPKYLNSPETSLFEKGRELYGLFQARQPIREAGMAIVVEGYMDVVALAQYGIGYAVATLGTATTPWQVQKLLRQTDLAVYCFDGDDAGRRAAWRALENSLGQLVDGKQVRFLFLPESEDPDSYVRAYGREAFVKLLLNAQPLSEVLLQELASRGDLRTAEGRAKFLQDAKPLVKQVAAPMLSLLLRKRVAELAGVSQSELEQRYEIKLQAYSKTNERRGAPRPSIVRKLTEMLVFQPALARLVDSDQISDVAELIDPEGREANFDLLRALLELGRERPETRGVVEYFRGGPLELVAQQAEAAALALEEHWTDAAALEVDFRGAWRQLMERIRKARIDALLDKSKRIGWTAEDQELYRRLQQPLPGGRLPAE